MNRSSGAEAAATAVAPLHIHTPSRVRRTTMNSSSSFSFSSSSLHSRRSSISNNSSNTNNGNSNNNAHTQINSIDSSKCASGPMNFSPKPLRWPAQPVTPSLGISNSSSTSQLLSPPTRKSLSVSSSSPPLLALPSTRGRSPSFSSSSPCTPRPPIPVLYNNEAFDLSRFTAKHPGGDFFHLLANQDITLWFDAAHPQSIKAASVLKQLKMTHNERTRAEAIKSIDKHTHAVDRELIQYYQQLKQHGVVTPPLDCQRTGPWSMIWKQFRVLVYTLAATLIVAFPPQALASLSPAYVASLSSWAQSSLWFLLYLFLLQGFWLNHDLSHDSIFASEFVNERLSSVLSIITIGLDSDCVAQQHRLHHAFPNVLSMDQAVNIGPIVFNREMAAACRHENSAVLRLVRRFQPVLWYVVVGFATLPFIIYQSACRVIAIHRWWSLLLLCVRWYAIVFVCPLWLSLGYSACSLAAVGTAAFFGQLNHFHLPMRDLVTAAIEREGFGLTMLKHSQNIEGPSWLEWLCGSLNLHIEHHLFPTVHRSHYKAMVPFVKDLCERHGLPYYNTTVAGIMKESIKALKANNVLPDFNAGANSVSPSSMQGQYGGSQSEPVSPRLLAASSSPTSLVLSPYAASPPSPSSTHSAPLTLTASDSSAPPSDPVSQCSTPVAYESYSAAINAISRPQQRRRSQYILDIDGLQMDIAAINQ